MVIIGHVDLLLTSNVLETYKRSLDEIQAAATSASRLARQLLAFGRRQPQTAKIVDLNRILSEMNLMLNRIVGEDIEIYLDLQMGMQTVFIDRVYFEQIMVNLIVNARDAMAGGGRLTIRTHDEIVSSQYIGKPDWAEVGSYIVLEVIDTGIGMDQETLNHIQMVWPHTTSARKCPYLWIWLSPIS